MSREMRGCPKDNWFNFPFFRSVAFSCHIEFMENTIEVKCVKHYLQISLYLKTKSFRIPGFLMILNTQKCT